MRIFKQNRYLPGVSMAVLASLLVAAPPKAQAQAYLGTPTVTFGSATIDSSVSGVDTITLPASSPTTTINWVPSDTAIGGGPIDFLPIGSVVNYVGDIAAQNPYTVLNRIIPTDTARAIRFDGIVNSTPNTNVWFYSPGGLLIGSSASFNVGGLLLSANDLVTDVNGNPNPVVGQFSTAGVAGSNSAIVIEPGAQLRAETVGQSNYIVAVAPRIQQDGLVSARGSVALVAAESADFAIDANGLFNITVLQGTEVTTDTFTHSGSTGGPDATANSIKRRVYMVAVPKNDAITMAIETGGSIGFDVAGAADLDGNEIVLSAGHNIADTGTGNPIDTTPLSSSAANISIARGSYTSRLIAGASGEVVVTDLTFGGTPDIDFASNVELNAVSSTSVSALQGSISVAGDLTVRSDASPIAASGGGNIAGFASINTAGPGASITVGGNTIVSASAIGENDASGNGGLGYGGSAAVVSDGGAINFQGNLTVSANGTGGDGAGSGGEAKGGVTQIESLNGGSIISTGSNVLVEANALGGNGFFGGTAIAGNVTLAARNGGSINLNSGASADAAAIGGDSTSGPGGPGSGGNVSVLGDEGILRVAATSGGLQSNTNGQAGAGGGIGTRGNLLIESTGAGAVTIGPAAVVGGNVEIAASLSFAAAQASISAANDVTVNTNLINTQANTALALRADNAGSGSGTVIFGGGVTINLSGAQSFVDIYHNPAVFGAPTNYSANVIAGQLTSYQLVNSLTSLQAIDGFTSQNFALNRDIDASETAGWNGGLGFNPIGSSSTAFTGNFDGLNHKISNLYINRPAENHAALFATYAGLGSQPGITIKNLDLVNVDITGLNNAAALIGQTGNCGFCGSATILNVRASGTVSGAGSVGGLIGGSGINTIVRNSHSQIDVNGTGNRIGGLIGNAYHAQIYTSSASGNVTGGNNSVEVGGLIGWHDYGSITQSYASGNVTSGTNSQFVGGLTGTNWVTVTNSYATGNVTVGTGSQSVGGLIGQNLGPGYANVDKSWSSGLVSGAGSTKVGGFVGDNMGGVITSSYWDSFSSGQASAFGLNTGTITNLNAVTSDPGQSGAANYAFNLGAYGNFTPGQWLTFGNQTRPIGIWEAPIPKNGVTNIYTAHQLQFIEADLLGNYRLSQNIDLSETVRLSGIWGSQGFLPFGIAGTDFSGQFDGAGHILSNLYINRPTASDVGLFGRNSGTIQDLGLSNASISGGTNYTGAIAGSNDGFISGSFATGTVNGGGSSTGGLAGFNQSIGTITQSYSSASVTGANYAGGITGGNAGTINYSYANGPETGPNAGGLAGSNAVLATISDSYWDNQTTAQFSACGVDDGINCGAAIGLTTAQSQQAASYVGWSIDSVGGQPNIWRIYDGQTAPLLHSFLRPLIVGPANASRIYDGTVQTLDVLRPGADLSHVFGTGFLNGASRNVGSYIVSYGGGHFSDQLGYDIIADITVATLDITPAPLTLDAGAENRGYDATNNSTGSVLVWGLVGGDSVTGLSQSFDSANAGSRTLNVDGSYLIDDGNGGNNYTITTNSAAGTIAQAALTLLATTDTRTYNAANDSTGIVGIIGLQGTDSISGLTQSFDSANAGARTLNVDGGYLVNDGNGGNNYFINSLSASGMINQAALTLSAVSDTRAYNAAIDSSGTVSIAGLQGTDSISGLTQSFDSANAGARTLNVDGGYLITDGNGGNNYTVNSNSAVGSITQAALTLSAVTDTRTYNAAIDSSGTVSIAGLQGTDSISGLTQSFDSANAGARTLNVDGGYFVNDGNGGNNYTVNSNSASGVINQAMAVVTYTANPASSVYGDMPAGLSGTASASGLFGSDTLATVTSGAAAFATTATNMSDVGSYAITGAGLSGNSGNYIFSFIQDPSNAFALDITQRSIMVSADAQSRLYGDANPAFTYNSNGLVNGDVLSGSLTSSANLLSNVGSYGIDQGSLAASANYSLVYNSGALSVTQRPLSIIADPQTRVYGDANPAFTYSSNGLVNGDVLSGSLTSSANLLSNVGSYGISQGSLAASANYALSFNPAVLSVTQRALIISATAQSRLVGEANPALTYGSSGLVNGDVLTGSLATDANLASLAGNYAITQGSLSASANYAVSFGGAALSVFNCAIGGGCSPVLDAVKQVSTGVQSVAPTESAEQTEEEQKAKAAAESSADPDVMISGVIDTSSVTMPTPIDEPVSGGGNSTLWLPGASK